MSQCRLMQTFDADLLGVAPENCSPCRLAVPGNQAGKHACCGGRDVATAGNGIRGYVGPCAARGVFGGVRWLMFRTLKVVYSWYSKINEMQLASRAVGYPVLLSGKVECTR